MARVLKPDAVAIAQAAEILRAGGLVAFPTETVYGLGADATNAQAVAKIFEVKGRPAANPLICHMSDQLGAEALAVFDERAKLLAQTFWPGPLTLVLPQRPFSPISELVTAGLATLALRVPSHPVALALLKATAKPLAAPSANPSGRISPTSAAHVAEGLGDKVDLVLDGGPCSIGLESTIVGLSAAGAMLLRPGAIAESAIAALIGELCRPRGDRVEAPGMMATHYAPARPLRLEATAASGLGEALLAFGPKTPPGFARVLNLSETGDLARAAANLYAYLRCLDRPPFERIAVMPIPEQGLGVAINDRLRRAAKGKDNG
jgi:L-threonylcarbamoyladenylate synthase